VTAIDGAAQLDREVQGIHDRYWENQRLAADRKSVLLVEGDDDRDVLETFLYRRSRTFAARVRVVPAGGRARVIARMKNTFPGAYGLVDRDTWTDAEIAGRRQAEPRLYVTEGWCLENAFFGPSAVQRLDAAVAARVTAERERWVRAGALWWTLQHAREAQQSWEAALEWSYGSPRDDLDLASANGLVKSLNRKIPEPVRRRSALDVQVVAEAFAQRCSEVLALPEAEQWRVVPALRSTPQAARLQLAGEIELPTPLDDLVAILLA
jgi:hypothetical protein